MSQDIVVIKDSLRMQLQKEASDSSLMVLNLKGFLDTYNSADFQREVNKIIDTGFIKLVFNCSELNYVSSTGIGAFTSFLKSVKQKHGDMVLSFLQPKVFEVFQLLGFSKFFNITSSFEEAKQILVGQKQSQEESPQSLFPKIFKCPICKKNLKAGKAGRFRCSECKTILNIDEQGRVFLG